MTFLESFLRVFSEKGGFHLAKIIGELKSHMIPYKFKCSHWLNLQHSDWTANLVKDFFSQINFPPMRELEFIRDLVTFKLPYDFSYQLKTPLSWHELKVQTKLCQRKIVQNTVYCVDKYIMKIFGELSLRSYFNPMCWVWSTWSNDKSLKYNEINRNYPLWHF